MSNNTLNAVVVTSDEANPLTNLSLHDEEGDDLNININSTRMMTDSKKQSEDQYYNHSKSICEDSDDKKQNIKAYQKINNGMDFDDEINSGKENFSFSLSKFDGKINSMVIVGGILMILIILMSIISSVYNIRQTVKYFPLIQGSNDLRSYKALMLSNKLKIVLISDPKISTAGVAMNVGVGSKYETIPGLAHFLEHMLFMGSKKYPDVNAFMEFIADNSGFSNAFTEDESTNFYYSISYTALEKSLDYFSRFFIDPLFAIKSINGEATAVDSEYQNDVVNPEWKYDFMLRLLANPQSPYSKFTIGNVDTLINNQEQMGYNIYDELLKFHSHYYSANLMNLVIISQQSVEQLEQMVKQQFSQISNKDIILNNSESKFALDPYPIEFLGKIAQFYASSDQPELYFVYKFDSTFPQYKSRPISYIKTMLNYAGPDSYISQLKEEGLITDLQAGLLEDQSQFCLFGVLMHLTVKGHNSIPQLMESFYSYASVLAQNGLSEEFFISMQQINKLQFDLNENANGDTIDEASAIAARLNMYPIGDVLVAEQLLQEYDEETIRQYFSNIADPEQSLILIQSNNFLQAYQEEEEMTDKGKDKDKQDNNESQLYQDLPTEERLLFSNKKLSSYNDVFKLSYNINPIPHSLIERVWENFDKGGYLISDRDIQLMPTKSDFFPKQLDLLSNCSDAQFDIKNTGCILQASQLDIPKIIKFSNQVQAWYKFDQTFNLPKYAMYISIDSQSSFKDASSNVQHLLLTEMLNNLVQQKFNADLQLSGYTVSIESNLPGLQIFVSGYSDQMKEFVEQLLIYLSGMNFDVQSPSEQSRFIAVKQQVINALHDKTNEELYKQSVQKLKGQLLEYYFGPQELYNAGQNITLTDLQDYKQHVMNDLKLQILITGSLSEGEAISLSEIISEQLNKKKKFKDWAYESRVRNVRKQNVVLRETNENKEDNNNLVLNYYQSETYNLDADAKMQLISNVIGNQAFDYLRTEKNLGYIATCEILTLEGVMGIIILVQGTKSDPLTIDLEEEKFLFKMRQYYNNLNESTFDDIKSSLMLSLQQKPQSLQEAIDRDWDQVRKGYKLMDFQMQEHLLQAIQTVSLYELKKFFKEQLIQGKVSIQLFSQDIVNNGQENETQFSKQVMKKDKAFINIQPSLINESEIKKFDYYEAQVIYK